MKDWINFIRTAAGHPPPSGVPLCASAAEISSKILVPRCGTCHGAAMPAAGLDLVTAGSKARLLNIPSRACNSKPLIVAEPDVGGHFFDKLGGGGPRLWQPDAVRRDQPAERRGGSVSQRLDQAPTTRGSVATLRRPVVVLGPAGAGPGPGAAARLPRAVPPGWHSCRCRARPPSRWRRSWFRCSPRELGLLPLTQVDKALQQGGAVLPVTSAQHQALARKLKATAIVGGRVVHHRGLAAAADGPRRCHRGFPGGAGLRRTHPPGTGDERPPAGAGVPAKRAGDGARPDRRIDLARADEPATGGDGRARATQEAHAQAGIGGQRRRGRGPEGQQRRRDDGRRGGAVQEAFGQAVGRRRSRPPATTSTASPKR